MATIAQSVVTLFRAYGELKDIERQELYGRMLSKLPASLVEKAVLKTMAEWKSPKVPPVGIVIANAESINATANESCRVKTWEEAWAEIDRGMYLAKEPEWSTPQITAAVKAYGWQTLIMSLAEDMPTVRAQMRRMYEDACARVSTQAHNEFLLGKKPAGILGIPKATDAIRRIGGAR